jgi:hypothetical protein
LDESQGIFFLSEIKSSPKLAHCQLHFFTILEMTGFQDGCGLFLTVPLHDLGEGYSFPVTAINNWVHNENKGLQKH